MKLSKSRIVGMAWSAISAAMLGAYLYLSGRNDEKADIEYAARCAEETPSPDAEEEEPLGTDTH